MHIIRLAFELIDERKGTWPALLATFLLFLLLVSEALTILVSVASLAGSEQTTVGRTKLLILKWF